MTIMDCGEQLNWKQPHFVVSKDSRNLILLVDMIGSGPLRDRSGQDLMMVGKNTYYCTTFVDLYFFWSSRLISICKHAYHDFEGYLLLIVNLFWRLFQI
jgi:hypothetical protein